MTTICPINEALSRLAELDGKPALLEGVLEVREEGYEILHYPKAERISEHLDSDVSYQPAVWVNFGNGSIQPNDGALKRWQGKRVRVSGVMRSLSSLPSFGSAGKGGFGPWGFWPAEIETYSIQRVTADERRESSA